MNFKNVLILTTSILKLFSIKEKAKIILQILIILIFNSFLSEFKAQNKVKNEVVNDSIRKSDTIIKKEHPR